MSDWRKRTGVARACLAPIARLERGAIRLPHIIGTAAGAFLFGAIAFTLTASAQSDAEPPAENQRQYNALLDIANTFVVGMLGGSIGSLRSRMIVDIGTVINRNPKFRVVPVIGKSAEQNIDDLFLLRGVDIVLAQSDVLATRLVRERGKSENAQLRYISRLHSEEVHVVANSNVPNIQQLEGRFVNFGLKSTGTPFTAARLFRSFGIKVLPIYVDHAQALQMLREGKIAATVQLEGKPDRALADIDDSDELRLLDVPLPQIGPAGYVPTRLTHSDYPQLIDRGRVVRTVGVDIILVTRSWPASSIRHVKIDNFVQEFLVNAGRLQGLLSHPKWRQFDPVSQVRGLPRFNISPKRGRAKRAVPARGRTGGRRTGSVPSAPDDSAPSADELFREFKRWSEGQAQ